MARDVENEEIARCRKAGAAYVPFRYVNGDTRKQLLARAKYILTKHASKWTKSQHWRADIIFEFYPELKKAYDLAMDLTDIFNQKVDKDTARLNLARGMTRSTAWMVTSSVPSPRLSVTTTIPFSTSLSIGLLMP